MFKSEKELLLKVREVKLELDAVTTRKVQLENEFKLLKYIVSNYLFDIDAKTTAKYDGIGFITLKAPLIRAEMNMEQEEAIFDFIRKMGEPEIIKLSVHHSALDGFVGRCIDKGVHIPEGLSYRFEPSILCKFTRNDAIKPNNEA